MGHLQKWKEIQVYSMDRFIQIGILIILQYRIMDIGYAAQDVEFKLVGGIIKKKRSKNGMHVLIRKENQNDSN